jgi:glycosyltransferase involved in cell wall biosynthesis
MKIFFLLRSLNYGGAERQVVLLAKGLRERGHQPLVVVFYHGGPLEKDLREAGVPVIPLNKRGRWDLFRFLLRLMKVLRRERPDIVHGYLFEPNLLAVMLKPLVPAAKIVWGVRTSSLNPKDYDWLFRLSFMLNCWFAKYADAVIANSRVGRDYHLSQGYPSGTMSMIPNGVDTIRFSPDSNARRRSRSEWKVGDHETLIGIVGRLAPMKDHSNFLEAAALLMRERKHLRFVCVGDGPAPYKTWLQDLAMSLGLHECLLWIGARQDIPAVYNALDLLVSSSSDGEGIANVVGEAMACGLPCAVTDVGDSAWIVGDRGEVVPPKDPGALKNAVLRLLDHRRYSAAQIRQRILDELSIDKLVVNTEGVLARLVENRRWPQSVAV